MGQSWRGHNATRQYNQRIISVILIRTENSSWMSNSNICSVFNAHAYVPDSDWHLAPVYPSWQLQVYPLILSVHDPPFKQGLLEHSLMSAAKCPIWETTTFHGNILRLITSLPKLFRGSCTKDISYLFDTVPAYPGWQIQAYPLTWSVQDPPVFRYLNSPASILNICAKK